MVVSDTGETPTDPLAEECTTTTSFDDHGVRDATDLVTRTYYRLQHGDRTDFEPTEAFFDALESAFLWAYLGSVEEGDVPEHVQLAVDDALELTREEFAGHPDADLRTTVLPAFYERVAGFHCRYRD